MDKNELRKKYLNIRKSVCDKDTKAHIIFSKIIELDDYKKASTIGLYMSLDNEVSTKELISFSIKQGKAVALPRVIDNDLVFYKIESLDNLVKSDFGVLEPVTGIIVDKGDIDLIIVPGICFDTFGNRIGFGKGFYDRYLDNTMNSIGICFDEQLLKTGCIETTDNDIKVKKIITEKGIVYGNSSK